MSLYEFFICFEDIVYRAITRIITHNYRPNYTCYTIM